MCALGKSMQLAQSCVRCSWEFPEQCTSRQDANQSLKSSAATLKINVGSDTTALLEGLRL